MKEMLAWPLLIALVYPLGLLLYQLFGSAGLFVATVICVGGSVTIGVLQDMSSNRQLVMMFVACAVGVVALIRGANRLCFEPIGKSVGPISVRQAPDYPQARVFQFTDGHLYQGARGYAAIVGGPRGIAHKLADVYVYGLVPEGWRKGDPIPAWVAREDDREDWAQEKRRAAIRRHRHWDKEEIERAIRGFEEKTGARAAPGAPVLEWTDDPQELSSGMWIGVLGIGATATAIVLLASLI